MEVFTMNRWVRKQTASRRRKVAAAAKLLKGFVAAAMLHRLQNGEYCNLEDGARILGFCKELQDGIARSFKAEEL
jgi:hypothetical protein